MAKMRAFQPPPSWRSQIEEIAAALTVGLVACPLPLGLEGLRGFVKDLSEMVSGTFGRATWARVEAVSCMNDDTRHLNPNFERAARAAKVIVLSTRELQFTRYDFLEHCGYYTRSVLLRRGWKNEWIATALGAGADVVLEGSRFRDVYEARRVLEEERNGLHSRDLKKVRARRRSNQRRRHIGGTRHSLTLH